MNHRLVQAPTDLAVTLEEARLHCRVDGETEDTWFTTALEAAIRKSEEVAERAFCTQRWLLALDAFPSACETPSGARPGRFLLPRAPVSSVVSIEYYDTTGVLQTLDSSKYQLDDLAEPAELVPAANSSWPCTECGRINAVRITYEAGYGDPADVDARAKMAVLFLLGHWYENRGSVLVGETSKEIEDSHAALLRQIWPGRLY